MRVVSLMGFMSRTQNLINNISQIIQEICDIKKGRQGKGTFKLNYQSLTNSNPRSHENSLNPNTPHKPPSESPKYSVSNPTDPPLELPPSSPPPAISTDLALPSWKDGNADPTSSPPWNQLLSSSQSDSVSESTETGEEWSEIREGIGEGEEEAKVGEEKVGSLGKTLMDSGERGAGLAGLTTPSNCP